MTNAFQPSELFAGAIVQTRRFIKACTLVLDGSADGDENMQVGDVDLTQLSTRVDAYLDEVRNHLSSLRIGRSAAGSA